MPPRSARASARPSWIGSPASCSIVRDWSICPIACFPGGCRHICRHECFALAMVAASQNKDLDCLAAAMRHLIDPDGHEEAMLPALAYAEAMRDSDLMLMPVPQDRHRRNRRPARCTSGCTETETDITIREIDDETAQPPSVLRRRACADLAAVVSSTRARRRPMPAAVVDTYGDVALAMYEDALATAKDLQAAVDAFLAAPTEETLAAAQDGWKAARVPYQQTEGYRFGNAIVDDWEGKVNAWPLDEGLIDYVDTELYGEESEENPLYTANVIANPELRIGPDVIDATTITPELLAGSLQEAQGVEIERRHRLPRDRVPALGPGPERHRGRVRASAPATDYDAANCTNGNCDRRAAYLKAATDLLVADLEEMVANWQDGGAGAQGPRGEGRRRRRSPPS